MRSFLLATVGFAVLACAAPVEAAVVVPAGLVAPAAPQDTASASPLLQKVWWDRWHHWHRRHHHWHHYPR
jgi:hypothetical protein